MARFLCHRNYTLLIVSDQQRWYIQCIHVMKSIRICHECERGIENPFRGSLFGITRLVEFWQSVIPRDRFLYSTLTQIIDFFFVLIVECLFWIHCRLHWDALIHDDVTLTSLDDHVYESQFNQWTVLASQPGQDNMRKDRIFLLVDLREFFFRFRVGGTKKNK